MIQTYTNLMRRFADARPGLKLLAVEEAALPVTVLRTDALVHERTELPATDEFFLRFVDAGVDSVEDIAGYLGLPSALVLEAAVRQSSSGNVERIDAARFATTQVGRAAISDFVASRPTLKQITFVFDRLAWRPAPYQQSPLLRRGDASQAGRLLIPASSSAAITTRDVAVADLNRIMPGNRAAALRLNRIVGRKHLWAPAQLLVFGDAASREIELAVYVDDEIVQMHEHALQSTDVVARLDMSLALLPAVPTPRFGLSNVDPDARQEDVVSIEHRDHLLHALLKSEHRLTIASPSAGSAVVTETFSRYVRDRASAGVDVTVLIDRESQVDERAASRLTELSRDIRVGRADLSGSTHLIYDDVHIESNFDWLVGGQLHRQYTWSVGRLTRSERNAGDRSAQLIRDATVW
ncbi:hypothetical protein [Microbacterium sp. MM2322]|uniref:hypothetical protein n=1 Tax=Microbacterium sp. MM2322 TaxID=3157631 RepID=UPI0032D56BAA